jgi:hypothetical protein
MMIDQAILKVNTTGHIFAFALSEDTFMRKYAEHFCEWIDGTVIKMSPVHDKHDILVRLYKSEQTHSHFYGIFHPR